MGAKQSREEGSATSREANQWLTQAFHDLRSVDSDMGMAGMYPSYEWACFKCQQAGEKAIKAVLILNGMPADTYKDDVRNMHRTDVMARDTNEQWIRSLAQQLYNSTGSVSSMRYPQNSPGSDTTIPHERYSETNAERAKSAATTLVTRIQKTYFPEFLVTTSRDEFSCIVM